MELSATIARLKGCAERLGVSTSTSSWKLEALYALYLWFYAPVRVSPAELDATKEQLRRSLQERPLCGEGLPSWFEKASSFLLRDIAERVVSQTPLCYDGLDPLASWYLAFAVAWCTNHKPISLGIDKRLIVGATSYAARKRELGCDPFFI